MTRPIRTASAAQANRRRAPGCRDMDEGSVKK
jgi:hypothetical protein